MSISLADIQAQFAKGLNPFSHPDEQIQAAFLIRDKGALTTLQRLQVYQRNVSGAHIAVLEQIFPVCRDILGENTFATYAREYCWKYPEADPDLNDYGTGFASFLSGQERLVKTLPYLPDLARLEYQWHQAWFSADAQPFDFEKLAQYQSQPERIRFTSPEHMSLLESEWPVHAIWQQHREGTPPKTLEKNEVPDRLLIIRRELHVLVEDIDASALTLLKAITQGLTLAELSTSEQLAPTLSQLPHCIEQHWITGFELLPDAGETA